MTEGRQRDEWNRTASIIEHLRLCNGDRRADARKYNPFDIRDQKRHEKKNQVSSAKDLALLMGWKGTPDNGGGN